MGHFLIKSDNVMTEILSAFRFKKEIVNGKHQYGYILFYKHSHQHEFTTDDGNIEYDWDGGGEVKESYILTDYEFGRLLESEHHVSMSPTYIDAFWKAYIYTSELEYSKLSKEEFFYHYNKYYHLTTEQNMQQSEDDLDWDEGEWQAWCKEMKEDIEFSVKDLKKEIQKLNLDDTSIINYYMNQITSYIIG